MSEHDPTVEMLAATFEATRPHLRAVAYRMLGSASEAEDAVQEAWIRLSRSDASGIDNLGGWLTTVVGRVCLDMLRSRGSRREEPLEAHAIEPAAPRGVGADPEHDALIADAIGPALVVVLDTLAPTERLAFVLHDLFGVPFDEIAPIVGRTPAATRQLASRARRRVQGAGEVTDAVDHARRRAIVDAFLAASRGGDLDALVAMLDPDAVLRADAKAAETGAPADLRGAHAVAGTFAGRAKAAQLALIDGEPGLVWAQEGTPRVVFALTFAQERISEVEIIADPASLAELEITILDS